MARGLLSTTGAIDIAIGAAADAWGTKLVIQCTALGAALTVKARVIGSGAAYSAIMVTNRATDVAAATAAAPGIFVADISGLEAQLSFAGTATYAYQMVNS